MKKLLLLSLCSLFLVSCGSDFLENEKSKHPERFYYHDRCFYGTTVKVYDGNKLINEYKHVRNVKTMFRGSTKIILSNNSEIFISNNYNIVTYKEGYCAMLYNGDVICIGTSFEDYGYFTDYCYSYHEDDYKEFYNIKD